MDLYIEIQSCKMILEKDNHITSLSLCLSWFLRKVQNICKQSDKLFKVYTLIYFVSFVDTEIVEVLLLKDSLFVLIHVNIYFFIEGTL